MQISPSSYIGNPSMSRSMQSLILLCGLILSGCGTTSIPDGLAHATEDTLDLGQDWADRTGQQATRPQRDEQWSVLLGTYTGEGHELAVRTMAQSCATIDARLAAARTHSTHRGSMVIYGAYPSADDPAAQADLKWIKNINLHERSVFPRAMLTRINLRHARGEFRVYELLGVRREHPNVDPLYTLQVAIWGDFDDEGLGLDGVKERAEAHARQLRTQGYEAYFHHDEQRAVSAVTIGLFDRTALDVESGLIVDRKLRALMDTFPLHLLNGVMTDKLLIPNVPELGTRNQQTHLVEVPRL